MAIDNAASFVETVSGTSHSSSLTLGSGTSRKVIVIAFLENAGTTLTGATFDGNAMTSITSVINPGDSAAKMYAWYYDVSDGTGTGSKTVTVTSGFAVTDVTWYAWQASGRATGTPEYGAASTATNSVSAVTDSAVSCTQGADVFAVVSSGSATPTFTWSGGTVVERAESNETNYTTCCADAADVTSGTKTVTATASVTSGFKNLIVVSAAAVAASGLTITSVTPSSFDSGLAGIVIAGAGFGASQGFSTVDIGGQAQTVTAWGDTSITITSARGSNSMGAGQLKVTIR